MAVIYNLFEEHTVEETSFVDWNLLPPIYDEYIDEDEVNSCFANEVDEDEISKLYSSSLYNFLEDDIVIHVINEILECSFLNVEHQVKIVDVKDTLRFMSEVNIRSCHDGGFDDQSGCNFLSKAAIPPSHAATMSTPGPMMLSYRIPWLVVFGPLDEKDAISG
ncbi:unnamed protein product [Malus baccata var. baccata]